MSYFLKYFKLINQKTLKKTKAYRLEPLILKHYTSKTPVEIQRASDVAKKGFLKDWDEKRNVQDVDLKSALSKPSSNTIASTLTKRREKDSRSAELSQMRDESNGIAARHSLVQLNSSSTTTTTTAASVARSSVSTTIEQVGK